MNTIDDNTAWAIPNKLLTNNTSPTPPVSTTNHPPVANAGVNQTVNENSTVMLNGIASDPDPADSELSYSWKQIAGPNVKLHDDNTTNPSFTAPTVSSDRDLKFLLTAKDEKGAESSNSAIVIVTVKHVNQHPVANAGQENQIVNPGDIVTLDGGKSTDPDSSDKLTYLWTQISGPTVKLDGVNTPIATFIAPSNISKDTTLVFKLTVKDSKNASGEHDAKVTDKYMPPLNKTPITNAGQDQTVNASNIVHLDGTKSRDPDGSITSYSWKQLGGPTVTLNGADKPNASFTAPSNISTNTVLIFGLTVTDDKNATGISTVKITVNPVNHPPVANAGQDQTVNPGYVVSLDGTKSKDPDNDLIKYSWKQIGGPTVELNGADQSIVTFTAPSNISSNTDLTFELTVEDDKNATNAANVKVTDKYIPPSNQPPIANADSDQTANAGDTVTLDGSGSTDPDGSITSYSWIQISGPAVTLNGADSSTPSFTAPSVSSDTELKFTLSVTDDKGATSNNNHATVTVTVKPSEPSLITNTTAALPSGNMTASNISSTTSNQRNVSVSNEYVFVSKWGSNGSGDGQFRFGYDLDGIAVDSSGNVYVADVGNYRVQKFDSNGNFITKWGSVQTITPPHNFPEFSELAGIAVDTSSGNVYVIDRYHIQKFDGNGKSITRWGSEGSEDGKFALPRGVAVDSKTGNVYVADTGNHRIQKFDSNGNFITKWGSRGSGDGQFEYPAAIAVDTSSGNVYVADTGNHRIQKFDSNGNFITKWGSKGTADGQFSGPSGVAVDSSGNVYVIDKYNNRVQKFDSNGKSITRWGSEGSGDGQFSGPGDVAVDSSGNVYVADLGNHRIQVFAPQK